MSRSAGRHGAIVKPQLPITAVVTPIKPAARYATPGYQPTSYTVGFDAPSKEYRIALTGLVLR